MTKSILNVANSSAFTPVSKNGVTYAITTPFNEPQKQELEEHKEKKSHKLGYNIARIALILGFGTLILTKGIPKGGREKVSEFFKYLDAKTIKLSAGKKLTGAQKFYYNVLKIANPVLDSLKAIFTLGSLKDIFLKKAALERVPFLNNISNKITQIFEDISIETSRGAYIKALNRAERMFANFDKANSNLEDPSLVQGLTRRLEAVREHYTSSFSEVARNRRLDATKKAMDAEGSLAERFWDKTFGNLKRFLTSKQSYTTFIPEEMLAPVKKGLNQEVISLRNAITLRFINHYNDAKSLLGAISRSVDPTDDALRAAITNIRKNLELCKKSGKFENGLKTSLLQDVGVLSQKLPECDNVKSLQTVIASSGSKGEIQEILEAYKGVLSKGDYARLEKSVNKTLDSLDKAIDLETDKLFDKIRDFKIGSAPQDVLGVLTSLLVVGWGLSKADNNDERISVALKYGIPAIGSVMVSLYCTIGLQATGPSLIIGLLSGLAINKIGEIADNMRKQYQNEHSAITLPKIDLSSPIENIKDIEKHS